jgi:hypothetical protein
LASLPKSEQGIAATPDQPSSLRSIVVGGGCFWCIEAVFAQVVPQYISEIEQLSPPVKPQSHSLPLLPQVDGVVKVSSSDSRDIVSAVGANGPRRAQGEHCGWVCLSPAGRPATLRKLAGLRARGGSHGLIVRVITGRSRLGTPGGTSPTQPTPR